MYDKSKGLSQKIIIHLGLFPVSCNSYLVAFVWMGMDGSTASTLHAARCQHVIHLLSCHDNTARSWPAKMEF